MSTQWLAQLAPEHAPAPPGLWPPAPGWWVCAGILVLAVAVMTWWRDPRRQLRRTALAELRSIRAGPADPAVTARALENLMRRYALAVFGPDATARLTGPAWLAFIDTHANAAGAQSVWGASLLAACYGANCVGVERESWFTGVSSFLRRAGRGRERRPSRERQL
jgi:hypothetical protein